MDKGIEHTAIVDIVEAVEIDPLAYNLVAHRVPHQVDCHIHHRSAYREHSDGHNLCNVRLQELGLPEVRLADSGRSSYKRDSFQKFPYYRMDRNVAWEEMLQQERFVPHVAMRHSAYKMLPQALLPHCSADRTGLPTEKARLAVPLFHNEDKISYQ